MTNQGARSSEIPEDVHAKAVQVLIDAGRDPERSEDDVRMIAGAILDERERCAVLLDKTAAAVRDLPAPPIAADKAGRYMLELVEDLAAAVRKGAAP